MAKHTPGPWRAAELDHTREPNHTYWHIEAGHGFYADKPEGDGFGIAGFMSEANVRLIAAAPELLEELKSMTARFGRCAGAAGNSGETIAAACASANAVIAKAEGITHAGSACVVPSNPYENRGNYRADGELRIGDYVNARIADCAALESACGPAVVVALDDSGSMDNRPSVWIRYTSNDGYYRYRSVDQFDVDLVRLPSEPPP